jgi:ABC-type glutathione transport system ATPase component
MCERVIILRNGQVVESGQTEKVLAAPQSEYGRTLMAAVPRLKSPPPRYTPGGGREEGNVAHSSLGATDPDPRNGR